MCKPKERTVLAETLHRVYQEAGIKAAELITDAVEMEDICPEVGAVLNERLIQVHDRLYSLFAGMVEVDRNVKQLFEIMAEEIRRAQSAQGN